MSNYYLAAEAMQATPKVDVAPLRRLLARLLAAAATRLSRARTRRALEALEPRLLADLGVPHEGASRDTGPLERYDETIRPRSLV